MKCWRTDCQADATTVLVDGMELCDLHTLLLRAAHGVLPGNPGQADGAAVAAFMQLIDRPQGE